MKPKTLSLVLPLITLMAISLFAGVPEQINFQAYLTDSGGGPLSGMHQFTFRLYDAETGGASLWQETLDVNALDGHLSVLLGTENSFNLSFDNQYWLSIEVESDGEMTPRFAFSSAPYALKAADADKLEGRPASDFADSTHNHDLDYSPLGHNHDGTYAPISHTHNASEITTGTLPISAIPVGNSAGTVAAGDDQRFLTPAQKLELTGSGNCLLHTHHGSAITSKVNSAAFADTALSADWGVLKNVPAGFADDIDNIGIISEADTLQSVCDRSNICLNSVTNGPVIIIVNPGAGPGAIGVKGCASDTGSNDNYGVAGGCAGSSGAGLYGHSTMTGPSTAVGVRGRSDGDSGTGCGGRCDGPSGIGVRGEGGHLGGSFETDCSSGSGALGSCTSTSGSCSGVHGRCDSDEGCGVVGECTSASGDCMVSACAATAATAAEASRPTALPAAGRSAHAPRQAVAAAASEVHVSVIPAAALKDTHNRTWEHATEYAALVTASPATAYTA
jgi:hypothetical protein